MSKVSILGTGTWASALGQLLTDNGEEVLMYGISQDEIDDINNNHQNTKYFGHDLVLPTSLKATSSLAESIQGAAYIIIAVPTFAIRDLLLLVKPLLKNKPCLISVSKGFDPTTSKRMSEVIREIIPASLRQEVVSLIGPGHAEEVILRMLTSVTSTSLSLELACDVQKLFSNNYFRVYTNTDEIGAEYGVAIKNVIALASGCLEGMGMGDNARAFLVTRGLHEMVKIGLKLGGQLETYLGLTGLGDLMVTCNSLHSRNFEAGFQIGKANSAKEFLLTNKKTVEGIRSAKVVRQMAHDFKVEMPIVEAIYQVLFCDKTPQEVLTILMERSLKKEIDLY